MNKLFNDKSTIVLREMMADPKRRWTVRELSSKTLTSIGLVSQTTSILSDLGMAEKGGLGRNGFIALKDRELILDQWTSHYDFSLNKAISYYSPEAMRIKVIERFLLLKNIPHALTLHSGANLITNYFSYDQCHFYLETESIEELAIELSAVLELKRLASGGNIHFVKPHYKAGAFYKMRLFGGFNVASNLQLYLDLYNFMPRGREHAEVLKTFLGNKLYE